MAARFGATIVPFGTVGEDDIAEVSFLLQQNIPIFAFLVYIFKKIGKYMCFLMSKYIYLLLLLQLVLDYKDLMKIPILNDYISEIIGDSGRFKLR